ncbi:hypothetical protein ACWD4P_26260, partial [Kitasatospora sp. NPDC002543]
PLVGTGMEYRCAVDAADVITAEKAGVVQEVSPGPAGVLDRRSYMPIANRPGLPSRGGSFVR